MRKESQVQYEQLNEERVARLDELRREIADLGREEKKVQEVLQRKRGERDRLMRQMREQSYGQSITNGHADPLAVAASELGPHITAWRAKRVGNSDYTLGVLAERTHVSRRRLRAIETGEQKFVTLTVADKILLGLGLNDGVDVNVVPNPYYAGEKTRQGCDSD